MNGHNAPEVHKSSFTCPHCGVYAQQKWAKIYLQGEPSTRLLEERFVRGRCTHCDEITIWYDKLMVLPLGGSAPLPSIDLPDEIRADYLEARAIAGLSPRSAAGLLRLAIQKLCIHLGESGRKLDDDIASLVRKGLDSRVQRMLDSLRVIGNESVHPGQIDVRDDPELVRTLFWLVNEIAAEMISKPHRIAAIYANLPQGARDHIEQRDRETS